MEIWATQSSVFTEVLAKSGLHSEQIAAIGITNQRETTVVWEKATGKPIYNAIVWQCRRTAAICEELKARGLEEYVRENTGLVLDAYFSGTKVKWILDNVEGAREKAMNGELLFGTIDTWLVWKMTNGEVHVTDPTNASRTMLYNIRDLKWDERMLDELGIPPPCCRKSNLLRGLWLHHPWRRRRIPIAGIAGDQQSALFGQLCFEKGMAKNTYGTGCFMLMNTGTEPVRSSNGLLTTVAIGPKGEVNYALEGRSSWAAPPSSGCAMSSRSSRCPRHRLLREQGRRHQRRLPGAGLRRPGRPYWDPYARGTMVGLTRGANRNHIIRAALESIAYQSRDVLDAMQQDSGIKLAALKVDGGAVANDFLMQFQADMMHTCGASDPHRDHRHGRRLPGRPRRGLLEELEELEDKFSVDREFIPQMDRDDRAKRYSGWKKAVERSRRWAEEE
jgi:glycerol kinase